MLVKKFDECLDFYTRQIGATVKHRDDERRYAFLATQEGDEFALFDADLLAEMLVLPEEEFRSDRGRTVLTFEVDDVDAMYKQMTESGVGSVALPKDRPDWGVRAAYVIDPDGNLVEINKPL
jgi:catechol 2,3-dioxygenase-like lactoylglutathione lyase family enzyme